MYQALYRKYRPNNFDDVVGQKVIIQSFKNAINYNKLSHAYLFSGPRGTGKTTVAKIIAKTVNCIEIKNALPCNKCVNCTQFDNKETTDIIEIDAASNNGVDEIRELKSKVNLVPSTGKYKVYIIDEVHMLTVGAFNALLKTLEEPPSHVIFILATTDPHKIPATILSRCQKFDFKKLTISQLTERLQYITEKEEIDVDSSALEEIARLSDGGMRDSISLLDQIISYVDINTKITLEDVHEMNGTVSQSDLKSIINCILDKDLLSIFTQFDIFNEKGKNLIKITEEILLFLRNLMLYKTVPTYFQNKNIILKPYEDLNDKVNIKMITHLIESFNGVINKMKISSNPKMIFELAIIKIVALENQENNDHKKSSQSTEKEVNIPKKVIPKKINTEKVSEQKKSDKKETVSNEKLELLNELKKIRINNTLSGFQRKILIDVKEKQEDFRPLILTPEYNEMATLILDGEIKAASDTNIVLVFEKEWVSDLFNQKLSLAEKLFEIIYEKQLKLISCNISEWNIIKKDFNSKTKQYTFKEEPKELAAIYDEDSIKTDIEAMFSDIIEYSN